MCGTQCLLHALFWECESSGTPSTGIKQSPNPFSFLSHPHPVGIKATSPHACRFEVLPPEFYLLQEGFFLLTTTLLLE